MIAAATDLLRLGGADAVFKEVSWAAGRIHYLEAGSGPPILLVHGAGGGAANWFGVIAALARTHRVIALDLPGFGLSTPTSFGGPLGLTALPAVEALLDATGVGTLDVCGTSFGGLIAVRFALAHPARVRRLALLEPAGLGREMPRELLVVALPLLGPVLMARPSRRAIRWELRRLTTSTALAPEREDALVAYLYACARVMDRTWFARAVRRFVRLWSQREVLTGPELAGLDSPTLLLWGTRDRFFPLAHAHRAAARIPRSVLVALPGCGHSPNWERPERVSVLLAAFFRT